MLSGDSFLYCVDMPITFNVEVNIPGYELLWDFGDGTTSTQNHVTHTYSERRIYNVSLTITTNEGGCTGASSNTTNFTVDTRQQYIIESDVVCAGELYSGYGFNNVHIYNDTILARLQDNPIHSECQDSVLLYITAHQNYHIPINDSRCWQGEPGVYDAYGFSFVYDHPGTYDRQLSLQTVNGCDSILNLHLSVADQITYEFSHHECNDSYVWDGQTYSTSGNYQRYYTSAGGCDSIVTMHLTMGMPQHTSFDTITCGVFYWNGQAYSTTGTYQQQFTTYDGCDSIVDCHLTLSGNVEGTTTEVTECDSYNWLGTDYTESGIYEKTLSTVLGCDSTVHLNLSLEYTPTPTEIYPIDMENEAPHWVVTATEFQINDYDFRLWDSNIHCHWDSVTWSFSVPNHWVLEPFGNKNSCCKMYVLEQIEDTVWLEARAHNRCAPEGIVQRYWFVCSFYGIDEDGPSTGSGAFEVTPNPNNGEMTLHFSPFAQKADVRVYDMRGVLIDHFQTEGATMSYHCPSLVQGMYLFVVTSKDGITSKKVIIHP